MPKYNKRKDGRYEKKIKLGTNDAGKAVVSAGPQL